MIAKQLEAILLYKAANTDFSQRSSADMAQRFQSLRGYGLLPKGRGKNAQHLTSRQAVAGIFSIVTEMPGYAGMASKVLAHLMPVGGIDASFHGARTFGDALVNILEEPEALASVLEIRASGSEISTNCNGLAAIAYSAGEETRTAHFVGQTALHLIMGKGAEKTFNPRDSIPTTIKETIYPRGLFERIARELKIEYPEHAFDHLVEPDEEEIERQKEERSRRLGITNSSNFLSLSVDTQVTWPKEETVVEFEGRKLILMPTTKDSDTSIHIDVHGQRLTPVEAHTLINRFLSLMVWCDDQFCTVQEGGYGSRLPVPTTKRNLAFSTAYDWAFDRRIAENDDVKVALALYRQGRNAEQNYLVPYAVLSYVKAIEIRHDKKLEKWFKDNWEAFKKEGRHNAEIERLEKDFGNLEPDKYLWKLCRVAVAHATVSDGGQHHVSDPDDFKELQRLHVAASVIRGLTRFFIGKELGVSEALFDGT